MPVVAAAIVPHSPVIVPSIAGEHVQALAQTRQAIQEIAAEIYARQAETLVFLTPHGIQVSRHITLSVAENFEADLLEFGDRTTHFFVQGAHQFPQQVRVSADRKEFPIRLHHQPKLDYGVTVPLSLFMEMNRNYRITPMTVGPSTNDTLLAFGHVLEDVIQVTNERVAVIASADLLRRSQSQTRILPAERTISEAIRQGDPGPLLNLEEVRQTCGVWPIISLLASLQRLAKSSEILSFEAPLGVGLLVARINT